MPNRGQWSGSAAAAAAAGPSAAAVLGVSEEELARAARERKRRFEASQAKQPKQAAGSSSAPKKIPRIAHSGGKITHNKESAIHKFVVRLLREGKPLTEAQIAAAKDAGVEVERLRDLYGYTDR